MKPLKIVQMLFRRAVAGIKRFFEWISSIGNLPDDSPETRSHKALLTVSIYACIANLLYFYFEYINMGRKTAAVTLLIMAIYFTVVLIGFSFHRNFKILRGFTFFGAFVYIITYHTVMGGFIGSVIYINYAIPVMSGVQIFYDKKSHKIAWYITYMITAVALFFLEPVISEGMVPLTDRLILLTHINNFVLIASLVFLSINYYANKIIEEKAKSDTLIRNILPEPVVNELNIHGRSKPVMIPSATAIFMDFVGFTRITQEMGPEELVDILNEHFTNFDLIFRDHKVEKLKTIGDGYMAVGGLPEPNNSHPVDVALAALQVLLYMEQKNEVDNYDWKLRIGIHTGPMVAGIIGETKFSYDVWGSSVNLCSRLETASKPGKINVSEEFKEFAKDFFDFEERGFIEIKNREPVKMFFITDIKKDLKSSRYNPNTEFYKRYRKYALTPIKESELEPMNQ